MASTIVAAATAALVGLLFAGTLGMDGIVIAWAGLSMANLPQAVVWAGVAASGLGMALLTLRLTVATWRVERMSATSMEPVTAEGM
ncbi:MAG: hypothetical protein P1U88_03200 [Thalassobaculaceae bacterium]|nr:hypothetical protein [Thalassobaculaceae bacterium]